MMNNPLTEGDVEQIAERMIARSFTSLVRHRHKGNDLVFVDDLRAEADRLEPPTPPPAQPMFTLTPTGEMAIPELHEWYVGNRGETPCRRMSTAPWERGPRPILRLDPIDYPATEGSE
jgi:hypothetical protein